MNDEADEVMSLEDFEQLIKSHRGDDGQYTFMGQVFEEVEMAQAMDVFCQWESVGIFHMPIEHLVEFFQYEHVMDKIGAKIVFALVLRPQDTGPFLLPEEDTRIIHLCRKRMKNQEHFLDIDCELEF